MRGGDFIDTTGPLKLLSSYRVEIGVDAVKIYWNLDQEFFERELKIKKPEARDSGFLKTLKAPTNSGSQSLTNGAGSLRSLELPAWNMLPSEITESQIEGN